VTDGDERERRLAKNEALIREVNDQVERISARWSSHEPIELVCECADLSCASRIHVAADDYRRVRENSVHFLIAPGHSYAEIEREVGRAGDAIVVEKLGPGREVVEGMP
jgi:hypothetical protein